MNEYSINPEILREAALKAAAQLNAKETQAIPQFPSPPQLETAHIEQQVTSIPNKPSKTPIRSRLIGAVIVAAAATSAINHNQEGSYVGIPYVDFPYQFTAREALSPEEVKNPLSDQLDATNSEKEGGLVSMPPQPEASASPKEEPVITAQTLNIESMERIDMMSSQPVDMTPEDYIDTVVTELISRTPKDYRQAAELQHELISFKLKYPQLVVYAEGIRRPVSPDQRIIAAWVKDNLFAEDHEYSGMFQEDQQIDLSVMLARSFTLSMLKADRDEFIREIKTSLNGTNPKEILGF